MSAQADELLGLLDTEVRNGTGDQLQTDLAAGIEQALMYARPHGLTPTRQRLQRFATWDGREGVRISNA